MIKKIRFFSVFIILSILTKPSLAEVSFNIKNEDATKTKILFVGFDPATTALRLDANEILDRVRKNLKTTDLFEIIKNNGRLESGNPTEQKSQIVNNKINPVLLPTVSVETIPDFEKYSKAQIGAIIVAEFNYDDEHNLEMRVRMWDVLDRRQLFGKLYSASKQNYKKVATLFSDEIFKAITGEKKGHFNSQITFISESGDVRNRVKRIAIMDFDGENKRFLTTGRDLVLTPTFAHKNDEIYYLRYLNNKSQIFTINSKTLRTSKLGAFQGTTFAASSHPKNSNIVLLSAIFDGNSDIYEFDITQNRAARLTKSPAIDTTASYSPDGKSIIFVSDRDSSQQIYIMNENGSEVQKISTGAGSYAKPVFSPDGSMIAFTRIKSGQFYIGTMSTSGKNERLLTSGYLVEGAKWSPNGRYLIYSKKGAPFGEASIPQLYIIDITSGFEFKVPTGIEGATDPDWIENQAN